MKVSYLIRLLVIVSLTIWYVLFAELWWLDSVKHKLSEQLAWKMSFADMVLLITLIGGAGLEIEKYLFPS